MLIINAASDIEEMLLRLGGLLDADSDLTVTTSPQTTVIDVGRAADGAFVIHDHQLAVDIDDLGDGTAVQLVVSPQAKEEDVVGDVNAWTVSGQSVINRVITCHHGNLLPMNLDT
jgi:hypothetical protein